MAAQAAEVAIHGTFVAAVLAAILHIHNFILCLGVIPVNGDEIVSNGEIGSTVSLAVFVSDDIGITAAGIFTEADGLDFIDSQGEVFIRAEVIDITLSLDEVNTVAVTIFISNVTINLVPVRSGVVESEVHRNNVLHDPAVLHLSGAAVLANDTVNSDGIAGNGLGLHLRILGGTVSTVSAVEGQGIALAVGDVHVTIVRGINLGDLAGNIVLVGGIKIVGLGFTQSNCFRNRQSGVCFGIGVHGLNIGSKGQQVLTVGVSTPAAIAAVILNALARDCVDHLALCGNGPDMGAVGGRSGAYIEAVKGAAHVEIATVAVLNGDAAIHIFDGHSCQCGVVGCTVSGSIAIGLTGVQCGQRVVTIGNDVGAVFNNNFDITSIAGIITGIAALSGGMGNDPAVLDLGSATVLTNNTVNGDGIASNRLDIHAAILCRTISIVSTVDGQGIAIAVSNIHVAVRCVINLRNLTGNTILDIGIGIMSLGFTQSDRLSNTQNGAVAADGADAILALGVAGCRFTCFSVAIAAEGTGVGGVAICSTGRVSNHCAVAVIAATVISINSQRDHAYLTVREGERNLIFTGQCHCNNRAANSS